MIYIYIYTIILTVKIFDERISVSYDRNIVLYHLYEVDIIEVDI